MRKIQLYPKKEIGQRLDIFVTNRVEELSRSYIKKLLKQGKITVNGEVKKPSYAVEPDDLIEVMVPSPQKLDIEPENIPLDVVFEDQDIIVINKPKGMVVHPAPGNYSGTLVNALLYHCDNLSGINGKIRPGIVHRLDKDTSGVMVAAKNDMAHKNLVKQLKSRQMKRKYIALVHGNLTENKGCIDAPIGRHPVNRKKMAVTSKNSKRAITHFQIVERFGDYTLIEATLDTGRTHQIRVHMSYIGHPVVGDPKYSSSKNTLGLDSQALHAKELALYHPRSGEYKEFTAPLPAELRNVIEKLRGGEKQ